MYFFKEIGIAKQALYPPGSTFGPRRIRDFEFVWIDKGNVIWHCDGKSYDCPAGSLLLVRPMMRDGFTWDPVKQTRHSFVHFKLDDDFFKSFPEHADMDSWPKVLKLPEKNIVFPLFDHLCFIQSQAEVDKGLESHCLLQILLAFIKGQCLTIEARNKDLHPAIERVFAYLREFWTEDHVPMPSITELVKASGVSEVHLGRLFHETFGMSPAKAIRTIRMERAAEYLTRSNMQIQEIAEILACDNPYHFSRSFKSVFDKSPKEYREYFRDHPYERVLNRNLPWSGRLLN